MSEMMTTELLVEAEWILQEYWTKGRYPIQTLHGGWSDFDVVAFHPHTKYSKCQKKSHLVIAEAKAFGTKGNVYVTTEKNKNITLKNIEDLWTLPPERVDPYFRFLHRINSDIDMADVKPLEQKNHAVSLDTTKHTVSTGFPHVPFFSDS